MQQDNPNIERVKSIQRSLPFLRRYARALLCDQSRGDEAALKTLENVVGSPDRFATTTDTKVLLFQTFHETLAQTAPDLPETLADLSNEERQAYLLCGMEAFTPKDAATIMARTEADVTSLVESARRSAERTAQGSVLVIEDELIIVLDLEKILSDLGHRSIGNARTHAQALTLIEKERPDLILADIHLADESSGIDAVNEISEKFADIPVVFITAYPERLLTGDRPEPSFLIAKPYSQDRVESIISQALLFARRTSPA